MLKSRIGEYGSRTPNDTILMTKNESFYLINYCSLNNSLLSTIEINNAWKEQGK